jgi:hypothetical protein
MRPPQPPDCARAPSGRTALCTAAVVLTTITGNITAPELNLSQSDAHCQFTRARNERMGRDHTFGEDVLCDDGVEVGNAQSDARLSEQPIELSLALRHALRTPSADTPQPFRFLAFALPPLCSGRVGHFRDGLRGFDFAAVDLHQRGGGRRLSRRSGGGGSVGAGSRARAFAGGHLRRK